MLAWGALTLLGGRVADFQSRPVLTCGCEYLLLLLAGNTSYCLGKTRGGSRRESQGSCDEDPEVGSERRGPFPQRLGVVVRACVRAGGLVGSMEPGSQGRAMAARPAQSGRRVLQVPGGDSAGVEALKWELQTGRLADWQTGRLADWQTAQCRHNLWSVILMLDTGPQGLDLRF